jgi:N-acetylmuramoyl-L-alanine amidase
VETGFITNPQEEEYLNSESGQDEIAKCITEALKNYKTWLEKKQLPAGETNSQTKNNKGNTTGSAKSFLEAVEHKEKIAVSK